jgi:hypothetical protein
MVALWLRHDNDHDQRHTEGDTPRIKKTRGRKSAEFEQRSNLGFGIELVRRSACNPPYSTIGKNGQKACTTEVSEKAFPKTAVSLEKFVK